MKSAVARIALLILLLITVAVRFQSLESRNAMIASFDVDAAIRTLIGEYGLAIPENPVKPPSILSRAVYFQRPECPEPSVAVPFDLNYEALPLLVRIVPRGYVHSFFYLDGNWTVQERMPMFVEWLKHAVLNLAGATRFLPVKTAVVVAEPAPCQTSVRLDWRLIWDKTWNRDRIEKGLHHRDAGEAVRNSHDQS
jgi:hypothetical protein